MTFRYSVHQYTFLLHFTDTGIVVVTMHSLNQLQSLHKGPITVCVGEVESCIQLNYNWRVAFDWIQTTKQIHLPVSVSACVEFFVFCSHKYIPKASQVYHLACYLHYSDLHYCITKHWFLPTDAKWSLVIDLKLQIQQGTSSIAQDVSLLFHCSTTIYQIGLQQ